MIDENMVKSYKEKIAAAPNNLDLQKEYALYLGQNGCLKESIEIFRNVLKAAPEDKTAIYNLSIGLNISGQYDEAMGLLKSYTVKYQDDPMGHYTLGMTYDKKDMLIEALQEFDTAIALNPSYSDSFAEKGCALAKLGKREDAVVSFKKAILLDQKNVKAHRGLVDMLFSLGQYDESFNENKIIVSIDPNQWFSYEDMAIYCHDRHRLDEAIEYYKKVIALNPTAKKIHLFLGDAYMEKKSYADAAESYKSAIKSDPGNIAAHMQLGQAYEKLKMRTEAIEEYKEAVKINPNSIDAHNLLGIAYARKGKYKDAKAEFEAALRLDQNNMAIKKNLEMVMNHLRSK